MCTGSLLLGLLAPAGARAAVSTAPAASAASSVSAPGWKRGRAGAAVIAAENALPGTPDWQPGPPVQQPAGAAPIELYASAVSVEPGDQAAFHVSTRADGRYRVTVYRVGWYGGAGGRRVACMPGCGQDRQGAQYPVPPPDPASRTVRAGWPVTDSVSVGPDWTTGYYVARAVVTQGPNAGADAVAWFVVRAAAGSPPAAILVQVPTNTWQAYNPWGGASLYNFNSSGDRPATAVSLDRPSSYLWQGPATWELPLLRFLERGGYGIEYQTDEDTDGAPQSLLDHRLVLVPGHSEYWTKGMRDAFDATIDRGTNLAFMGANAAYWQVRYADGDRTIVGWKSADDPEPDLALKTMLFRELQPARHECALLGVQHQGAYRHAGDPPIDYVVTAAGARDPWLAGSGLSEGSVLPDLVGREWDSVPAIPPAACAKPDLTVLLHADNPRGSADAVRWTAPSGARIFAAGTLQLAWALDDLGTRNAGHAYPPDPRVQAFVATLLADLSRPARPDSVSARVAPRSISPEIGRSDDPRVEGTVVYARAGTEPFAVGDPGVRRLCVTRGTRCRWRPLAPGLYRLGAVAVDPWGRSDLALGDVTTVADRPGGGPGRRHGRR